jgi:hypothetical protein
LPIGLYLGSFLVVLTASAQTPSAQQPETTSNKLPLRAELVLSRELCSAKIGHYLNGDVFSIGKAVCPQLKAKLNDVFLDVKPIEKLPAAGSTSAQVVLIPKFVDISATLPLLGSSQQELVIVLEWTVQDAAGKPIWLQTVQGSSQHKRGWVVTPTRRTELVTGAAAELANASASKMSAAPELRKLAQ